MTFLKKYKMLFSQYFYNNFTINLKRQTIICMVKKIILKLSSD